MDVCDLQQTGTACLHGKMHFWGSFGYLFPSVCFALSKLCLLTWCLSIPLSSFQPCSKNNPNPPPCPPNTHSRLLFGLGEGRQGGHCSNGAQWVRLVGFHQCPFAWQLVKSLPGGPLLFQLHCCAVNAHADSVPCRKAAMGEVSSLTLISLLFSRLSAKLTALG